MFHSGSTPQNAIVHVDTIEELKMEGLSSGIYIPTEDAGEGTQVNFSQRMQGAPDLSLLPNHNYGLGRNSQDFGCRSQERGKVML